MNSWQPLDSTNFQLFIVASLAFIYVAVRYVIIPERAARRKEDAERKINEPERVEKPRERKPQESAHIEKDLEKRLIKPKDIDVRKKYLAARGLAQVLSVVGYVAILAGIVAVGLGLLSFPGEPDLMKLVSSVGAIAGGVPLTFFGVTALLMAEAMLVLIDVEHNTRRTAEIQATRFVQISACPSCGEGIASDMRFCSKCGLELMSKASI